MRRAWVRIGAPDAYSGPGPGWFMIGFVGCVGGSALFDMLGLPFPVPYIAGLLLGIWLARRDYQNTERRRKKLEAERVTILATFLLAEWDEAARCELIQTLADHGG